MSMQSGPILYGHGEVPAYTPYCLIDLHWRHDAVVFPQSPICLEFQQRTEQFRPTAFLQ